MQSQYSTVNTTSVKTNLSSIKSKNKYLINMLTFTMKLH